MLWPLHTRRVDLTVIETFALLSIPEQIVSARDHLEFLFSRFVTGIKIRVQFLRKIAICLLDLDGRGRRGNTENLVRVSHDLLRKNFRALKLGRLKVNIHPCKFTRRYRAWWPCAIRGRLRLIPAYNHSNTRTGDSWKGSIKPSTATPQDTTTSAFATNLISGPVE